MKFQPTPNESAADLVMTPDWLAQAVVSHFAPVGTAMEPCAGDGAFVRALEAAPGVTMVTRTEISEGTDFLDYRGSAVDWIITNPPWSKVRDFMAKSFTISREVVFLFTLNHAFSTARWRIMSQANFGLKEAVILPWPTQFSKSGFMLGAAHWSRGYQNNSIKVTDLRDQIDVDPSFIHRTARTDNFAVATDTLLLPL